VSRWHTMLAAAWALLVVCFSRVYVGLHYASDILVGFLLGLALAYAVLRMPLPAVTWAWLQRLDARRPALVLLGLFMFGWAVGEGFTSIRSFLAVLREAARADKTVALLLVAVAGVLLAAVLLGRFVVRWYQAFRLGAAKAK